MYLLCTVPVLSALCRVYANSEQTCEVETIVPILLLPVRKLRHGKLGPAQDPIVI